MTGQIPKRTRGLKELLCIIVGLVLRWTVIFRRLHSSHRHVDDWSHQHQQLSTLGMKNVPKLEFLFFMGLEGTAHHMLTRLIEQSPIYQKMVDMNIHTLYTSQLQESLWNSHTQKGLWNAHCWTPVSGTDDTIIDVSSKLNRVVEIVQKIRRRVALKSSFSTSSSSAKVVVPLNVLDTRYHLSYGMVSFPNFVGPCRPLAYPNLDLWYDVCFQINSDEELEQEDGGVECNVVYLSRDPTSIIKSTARRKFVKDGDMLSAIHMYRTHLNIIASQIIAHPLRIKGCYDLLSHDPTDQSTWQDSLQLLLGWGNDNRTGYQQVIRSIYKPKPSINNNNNSSSSSWASPTDDSIPLEYQPYVDSLVRTNDQVTKLCRRALRMSQQ